MNMIGGYPKGIVVRVIGWTFGRYWKAGWRKKRIDVRAVAALGEAQHRLVPESQGAPVSTGPCSFWQGNGIIGQREKTVSKRDRQ